VVLVLARPSAREDGTLENKNARTSLDTSLGNPEASVREPKETIKETTR
jgi:hypothetical protein